MATSWRVAAVGAVALSLIGVGEPAMANPGETRRDSLISSIVDKADPELMQVVVTREDKHGRPTFETVSTPTKDKARSVLDGLVGAPGVLHVEMDHVVSAAHRRCRNPLKRWSRRKHKCVWRSRSAQQVILQRQQVTGGVPDPLLGSQWALDGSHFNGPAINSLTAGDTRPVYVAVIDSGVTSSHPDLAGRVDYEYNVLAPGTPATDYCGHGTHVAGTIAAGINNGVGISGMARTAVIRNIKVLDGGCSGSDSGMAQGIVYAADRADVLNLSVESHTSSSAVQSAINYALSKGRTIVAAAGNDASCGLLGCSGGGTAYPAAYSGVIGVAAVDQGGNRASFSSYGSWVDVAAPGVSILSTCKTDYCLMSGTSMATPHVSALAALLISHCGAYGADVADRIQRWASHAASRDNYTGYGIIRPYQALSCG